MSRFTIAWTFGNLGLSPFQLDVYFRGAERRWRYVITDWPRNAGGSAALAALAIRVDAADLNPCVPPDSGGPFVVARVNLLEQLPCDGTASSCLPSCAQMWLDHVHFYRALSTRPALTADIVAHEIGHALGFGTIWAARNLLSIGKTCFFTGTHAAAEYAALAPGAGAVPIDSSKAHWLENPSDDSELGRKLRFELMSTGVTTVEEERGDNRLTRLTVAAMQDLGYVVDMRGADAYRIAVAPAPAFKLMNLRCGVCSQGRQESPDSASALLTSVVSKPSPI